MALYHDASLAMQVRRSSDGIKNRCIKMALAAIFLSYPFVSQVIYSHPKRRSDVSLFPF